MHGFALVFLGTVLAAGPVDLPKDVFEIQTREFAFPVLCDPKQQDKIARIRLFVSEDRGKTWKHHKDCKPTDAEVPFTAPQDGFFWFALQIEFKDGKSDPAELTDLTPCQKIYVNSELKTLKVHKSYEELFREVEELRKTVEQLQKKIKELEADRKSR
jgi:hypothetical protein